MCDASSRLIEKYDSAAKYNLFEVCRIPEGRLYDDDAVKAVAQRLRDMANRCQNCTEKFFADVWVARFLDMGAATCMRAHTATCDNLALFRCCSTKVEKKHLVGQECKPQKRGRCVEASTL